ncbi:MAG: TolC family protein [Nitrospirota bacterium]|nr:TolC family protein [Nitrospirota bacterium]MDH5768087.1 TolC family protein [Nitrospirota bacterium]
MKRVAFILLIVILFTSRVYAAEYSLEDLYKIALERSEQIKISEEDLYIAERGKDKVTAALLPTVSAFSDYTKFNKKKYGSQDSLIQPESSISWGLRLDQSLSLGGREFTAFKISKENIEKSKHDLNAVKENYLLNVSSAYYDVLKAKKALEIAHANSERLTKHRDAAATRLKVGEVTKTDLLRAQAELSGSQSEVVKAENGLKLAKAVLARLVGLSEDYDIKTVDFKIDSLEEFALGTLLEEAVTERAELKSFNLQKSIAEEQVKFARGAYWPTLSIQGVYARADENPATASLIKEDIFGTLSLTFPFFEGGLRRAEVREAEAKQRQAELAIEDLKKSIAIEVENAYLDFMTQKGVLKSLEDQVKFARENFNSISKQYEFGLAHSIDVMDSNTLLVTAERQFTDAQYNYQLSILKVEKATGTLLKTVISNQKRINAIYLQERKFITQMR